MRKEYLKVGFITLIWFIVFFAVEWVLPSYIVAPQVSFFSLFSILVLAVLFFAIGLFLPPKNQA